jgi:hypothetical protein
MESSELQKVSGGSLPISNLYLVSFLVLRGIEAKPRRQGDFVTFYFPRTDEVLRLVAEFDQNPQVSLLDFVEAFRKTRSRMFAVKDGGHGKRQDLRI